MEHDLVEDVLALVVVDSECLAVVSTAAGIEAAHFVEGLRLLGSSLFVDLLPCH